MDIFKASIKNSAENTLGITKAQRNPDWFEDNAIELKALIDRERAICIAQRAQPTSRTMINEHKQLKAEIQRKTREAKNIRWIKKAHELQPLTDCDNTRAFFQATKQLYEPRSQGNTPLKTKDSEELIKESSQIANRWKEHFRDLLNCNPQVDESIFNDLQRHPTRHDMYCEPTIEEVKKTIKQLKHNKAAGPDGIPAELYLAGGELLEDCAHQLILHIWRDLELPNELKDGLIVSIFKKGN